MSCRRKRFLAVSLVVVFTIRQEANWWSFDMVLIGPSEFPKMCFCDAFNHWSIFENGHQFMVFKYGLNIIDNNNFDVKIFVFTGFSEICSTLYLVWASFNTFSDDSLYDCTKPIDWTFAMTCWESITLLLQNRLLCCSREKICLYLGLTARQHYNAGGPGRRKAC